MRLRNAPITFHYIDQMHQKSNPGPFGCGNCESLFPVLYRKYYNESWNHTYLLFAFWSAAKGPRKTPETSWKTSASKFSNGALFTSIRQILDYISASENKVSETTFSKFSEISRKSTNFPIAKNVGEKSRIWVCTKTVERQKHDGVNLTNYIRSNCCICSLLR